MNASDRQGLLRARAHRVAIALLAGAITCLVAAAPAGADDYGLPQLVSRPGSAQPNASVGQVAISASGRYIVYSLDAPNLVDPSLPASTPNAGGIYRYDTQTGQSALVAYGFPSTSVGFTPLSGAENASISADGRYVLFDSNRLFPSDPVDKTQHLYIRDMTKPVDDASSYSMPVGDTPAMSVGPHALSNDGTHLIWQAANTLDDGTANPNLLTVYWTDLSTGQTLPVSVQYDQSSQTMNPNAPLTDAANAWSPPEGVSTSDEENAVLSGDGTTVAWYSQDPEADTRQAAGEATSNFITAGVVWRRLADGDRAVTRRVTSPDDDENPDCTAATPVTREPTPPGPCDNPLLDTAASLGTFGTRLGLSDDGQKVVVLAEGHARGSQIQPTDDLYEVGMFPGQDPVKTIVPLTQVLPGGEPGAPLAADSNGPIEAATISGNGRYVVFVTKRILFPIDPPTQIGAFPTFVGTDQLYLIDLQTQQIQLLSVTPSGAEQDAGPSGMGSSAPVVSDDGGTVAFLSAADNLAPGDANGETDAFMVQQAPAGASTDQTGPQVDQLAPTAPDPAPQPDWSLQVDSVSSAPDGSVTLTLEPPAAGSVSASVSDAGGPLAASVAAADGSDPVTLTLAPHVTDKQGLPGAKRTRNDTAVLQFTPLAGAGGPITEDVPVSFELPAEKIGERARQVAKPRAVRLTLTLPAAGRLSIAATRKQRQAHRVRNVTFTNATKRATRAGRMSVMLTPSHAGRRNLPATRVSLHVQIRFTPASAGVVPPLTRTLNVTLPAVKQSAKRKGHG